jgi:hypothetical protein
VQTGREERNAPRAQTIAKKPKLLQGLAVKDGMVRHPFDLEFGVRTSGLVHGQHLMAERRHARHITAYYAIAPSVFQGMIARWRRCEPLAPIDAFTFIDLGAGMGRAMLLAAGYPFRAVVGVEINSTLARIGRRNMALWRAAGHARSPMRMLCRDASEFELPQGPCVAFLFNPFSGAVFRRILRRWSRSLSGRAHSAQLDILYVNNQEEGVLERHRDFSRLFMGKIRRSPADHAAERKILLSQPDGIYAPMVWEDCSIYRWTGTHKKPRGGKAAGARS